MYKKPYFKYMGYSPTISRWIAGFLEKNPSSGILTCSNSPTASDILRSKSWDWWLPRNIDSSLLWTSIIFPRQFQLKFDLERWNCKSKKQLLPRAASCKSGCSISFLRDLATNRSTFVNALHLSWFSLLLVMGTIPNAWCSGHCIARSIFSLANV